LATAVVAAKRNATGAQRMAKLNAMALRKFKGFSNIMKHVGLALIEEYLLN
jgi:hypothetical protein